MPKRRYLLNSDECPYCQRKVQELKNQIESGEIIVIDINSRKGKEIIKKLGINQIPNIIECKGKKCEMVE